MNNSEQPLSIAAHKRCVTDKLLSIAAHKRCVTDKLLSIAQSCTFPALVSLDTDSIWSIVRQPRQYEWTHSVINSFEIPQAVEALSKNMDWRDWVDSEVDG
jgi:hypothetical protein